MAIAVVTSKEEARPEPELLAPISEAECEYHNFAPVYDQTSGSYVLVCTECWCEESATGHTDALGG